MKKPGLLNFSNPFRSWNQQWFYRGRSKDPHIYQIKHVYWLSGTLLACQVQQRENKKISKEGSPG